MSIVAGAVRKLADIGFLARPALLCASCTFFFAGVVAAGDLFKRPSWLLLPLTVLPNFILFVLVVAAAFVINQIFDVESDRANRKAFILPSGIITRSESLAFLCGVTIFAVVLSLRAGPLERYLVWAGLALGFAYSVPPIRLKARPIADLVSNVAGFGIIGFGLGWLAAGGSTAGLALHSLPYVLAMAAIFLNTCIPDEVGDRMAGDRTSCVVFGARAVSRAALVLLFGGVAVSVSVGDSLCALATFASIPATIAVAVEPDSRNSVVASQFAARLLFVLISIRSPVLAVLGVASYVGSKIYYARRLGLDYPNLRGAQGLKGSPILRR
jgi:chlorophyll synthase